MTFSLQKFQPFQRRKNEQKLGEEIKKYFLTPLKELRYEKVVRFGFRNQVEDLGTDLAKKKW